MFEKQKSCSKCGAEFECGGLFGCWCRDVKLDRDMLAALKARYDDCLCPDCLKKLAVVDTPPNSVV
jgi:hypothetical protein